MFTCQRITSIEYYIDEAKKASQPTEGAEESPRDRMAYYLDNGAGEGKGIWWTPAKPEGSAPQLVKRGEILNARHFRDLSNGEDPITNRSLIQKSRAERMSAYDCQFGAPKSVSVLWASATPEQRVTIETLHRQAVYRALDFADQQGFIVTRRGKGGLQSEAVADVAVGEFMHTTSRAGDPQLHSHAVMLNVCVRADGTTGTLDNRTMLRNQGAMGAVYRAELASSLERELGVMVTRDKRNFKVNGVPDEISELFSKRRNAIEKASEINGYTTAQNRAGARLLAVATRDRKADVPERDELEERWTREIANAGWSKEGIWESAQAVCRRVHDSAVSQGIDIEAFKRDCMVKAGKDAIAHLEKNSAVMERRHLLCEVLERFQGVGNADEAISEINRLLASGELVQVGAIRDADKILMGSQASFGDEVVYATPKMIQAEKALLAGVISRKGERQFVAPELMEKAITAKVGMSDEQAVAVRHALNQDGVSVIEGSAGTGKSYSLGGVADAVRDAGMHVFVIAPSHKAKEVIRHDTSTDEDSAKATTGFLNRIAKGGIELTDQTAIIVDEAGMVGTYDMEKLLSSAQKAGAKVILAGDTKQLQPVSAGGPMSAIAKTCGTQRIERIRRQRVEWQRSASEDFAKGQHTRAMEAYQTAGRLKVGQTAEDAIAQLTADWKADLLAYPSDRPDARLVVTGRHKDVALLNASLRQAMREAGKLEGDDFEVRGFTRGQNKFLDTFHVAQGDRLIFGETVKVGTVTINNSDMATVESITPVKGQPPLFRIKLDKGDTIECAWSDLIGWREREVPDEERNPHITHGHCVVTHASQGTTVDRCFIYNGHGMGAESAYVAMTRHRDDATMYADGSRVLLNATAREKSKAKLDASVTYIGINASKVRSDDTHDKEEEDAEMGATLTDDQIAGIICQEVARSEQKVNVSDFVGNVQEWIVPTPHPELLSITPQQELDADLTPEERLEIQIEALDAVDVMYAEYEEHDPYDDVFELEEIPVKRRSLFALPSLPRATPSTNLSPANVTATPPGTSIFRLKMWNANLKATLSKGTQIPKRENTMASEGELENNKFEPVTDAGAELRRRMASREQGPRYFAPLQNRDGKSSAESEELYRFNQDIDFLQYAESQGFFPTGKSKGKGYTQLSRGADTINVKHPSGGDPYKFTTPHGDKSGKLVDFVVHYVTDNGRNTGQARKVLREYQGILDSTKTVQEKRVAIPVQQPAPFNQQRQQTWWMNLLDKYPNRWLMVVRGIRRDVLERFNADIKTESKTSHLNPEGACFAHRDDNGAITGFARKGATFSGFSTDGRRLFTRMGDRETPNYIYAGEASIDLLSAFQSDGLPARSLLCSFDGGTSKEALSSFARLVERHPKAKVLLAFDNDHAGENMALRLTEAVHDLVPDATVQRHFPPAGYKDWNDTIRGITAEMANAKKAEAELEKAKTDEQAQTVEADTIARITNASLQADIHNTRRALFEAQKPGGAEEREIAELKARLEALSQEATNRQHAKFQASLTEALGDTNTRKPSL